jgi:periplasmic protein TonB
MAMDRAEKLGLGAAVGGHVMLLGAMALGLFMSKEPVKTPEAISVSLVGEIAEVSTAPDAIQEESAPSAPAEAKLVEPPPAPVMQIEKPVEKQQAKPVPTPLKRDNPPPAKTAVKKVPVKQPPAKVATTATKSGKGTTPTKPGGFSKSFEDSINNVGKAPGAGKAVGTPASRSASVIRSAVNNTIAAEVRPLIPGCAPRTSDNSSLRVFVALNISPSAILSSADIYDVQGITPSNEAQVDQMKRCVLQSLKAASPYNLDPEEYEVWKGHKVQLKVNFK